MRIHIQDNIYLSSDNLGFYIEEKAIRTIKDKKTGESSEQEVFLNHGHHYVRFAYALNALLRMKLVSSTAETLGELLQEVRAHRAFIEQQITL